MNIKLPSTLAVLALLFACVPVPQASADEAAQGTLQVKVTDNWGVLPGATVTATDRDTGRIRQGVTGSDGTVTIADVPAGTWDLKVSLAGFADGAHRGVAVAEGESKRVDMSLTLVQFSTEVTVSTANRREEILLNVADPVVVALENTRVQVLQPELLTKPRCYYIGLDMEVR